MLKLADRERRVGWAIDRVHQDFDSLTEAVSMGGQAEAFVRLRDAVSDLVSWHPGFDIETGTMPWQREQEDCS